MSWLLNAAYALLIALASPWILWQAFRAGKYREGFAEKLLGHAPRRSGDAPCVWIHAVSVGEVNLIGTFVARWTAERPETSIYLSTTTKAGYDLARKKYPRCTVFYAPLDFTWAVRAAIERVRPSLILLAELELWPNWIAAASRHSIPVIVVNGRLSERSFRGYRRLRAMLRGTLSRLSLVAAQNDEYADRFADLGVDRSRIVVTGSVKFDGARGERDGDATRRLAALARIDSSDLVFLAGSTQHPEEALAIETFRRLSLRFPRLRLILVPRHPERFDEAARLLDQSGLAWRRRSQLIDGETPSARILLVDTIGELGAWWGTSHIGFVGGSLGRRGGQNMIEPAALGVAVCFGPNTQNFRDVVSLLLRDSAATVVADGAELTAFVERCLTDEPFRQAQAERGRRFVAEQRGATDRTWQALVRFLPVTMSSEQTSAEGACAGNDRAAA